MKPPRKPKKTVRKRKTKQVTACSAEGQAVERRADYAAVGERVTVEPKSGTVDLKDLKGGFNVKSEEFTVHPHEDGWKIANPQPATPSDIADEMRRVQDGKFYNEVRDLLINQSDPLLDIPMPDKYREEYLHPNIAKFWRHLSIFLIFCMPLVLYLGMFTQSQLPQKPRLSEINLCMHLGKHWNSAKEICE